MDSRPRADDHVTQVYAFALWKQSLVGNVAHQVASLNLMLDNSKFSDSVCRRASRRHLEEMDSSHRQWSVTSLDKRHQRFRSSRQGCKGSHKISRVVTSMLNGRSNGRSVRKSMTMTSYFTSVVPLTSQQVAISDTKFQNTGKALAEITRFTQTSKSHSKLNVLRADRSVMLFIIVIKFVLSLRAPLQSQGLMYFHLFVLKSLFS